MYAESDSTLTSTDIEEAELHESSRPRKRHKSANAPAEKVEWSDDDGEEIGAAAYKKFKSKRPEQRKRAVASAKRAKVREAIGRARETGTTGVGVQQPKKKVRKKVLEYDDVFPDDEDDDWYMPDYVRDRRNLFDQRYERLRDGGLQLAPTYGNVSFSEDEGDRLRHVKERPDLPDTIPLMPYRDVQLPYSAGVIPAPVAQYLRDYQIKGVSFLHELFVYQKGGILGDDMGLGKTIQIIAFLTAAYGKTGDERDRKRMRKMRRARKWYPKTLIICPGSLMSNWKDELTKWGWWNTELFHGSSLEKEAVLASAKSGMLEVMITTYNTYRLNKESINMIEWDCVVADECHVIKERKSEVTKSLNEVNALCRIGLTGTAIQNNYEELWTILNWTNPGRFGPLPVWKASISEPLKLGQSHNATNHELARARKTAKRLVENLLPQFFLRRMKTLIKDQLPRKTDRVVFCPLTQTQASAYENFLDCQIVQFIRNANELCVCGSGKKSGWCCNQLLDDDSRWQSWVFPAMMTLQKLANHLALLIPQSSDTQERQSKDLEYLSIAVPDQWKRLFNSRDNIIHQGNAEYCGKWRILRKLLHFWYQEGGNKVLVFSHSVRLLLMLQRLFDNTEARYNVAYLDGSMTYADRYAAVQNFNADPMQFVFLISTRAGGVGLNITSANKVVIVDPNWNPSYDLQAQDRAYRIGQTRDVEVYRLVSQGTIEEVVYARQIYKQQQANIGYTGSSERRYFQGVQDRKDQKGEIFGLHNLFAYENENIRLRDIVNKTNVAESKAGIRFHSLEVEERDLDHNSDDNIGTDDYLVGGELKKENEAMSQLAAEVKGEDTSPPRARKSKGKVSSSTNTSFNDTSVEDSHVKRHDPVQAILAAAGVSYTHENSEVIGSSRVEAELSRRAEGSECDTQQQQAKVFTEESQSRHVNAVPNVSGAAHLAPLLASAYDDKTNIIPKQQIKYKFGPPEPVKQRQFCTMAAWAGHGTDTESVINFALFIESCSQEQRREILDRFYRHRAEHLSTTVVTTATTSNIPKTDDSPMSKDDMHDTKDNSSPGTKSSLLPLPLDTAQSSRKTDHPHHHHHDSHRRSPTPRIDLDHISSDDTDEL